MQSADNNRPHLTNTATDTYPPGDNIETASNSDGNANHSYTYHLVPGNVRCDLQAGTWSR
jgi:hypothetical protein